MSATLLTLDSILKEIYTPVIFDEIAQKTLLYNHFEDNDREVNGKYLVAPLHTSRNGQVGELAGTDGFALLPGGAVIGNQGYHEYNIYPRFVYGRFQVDRTAMKAVEKGGAVGVTNAVDEEMKRLTKDVINRCGGLVIFGGPVRGYISEYKASTAQADTQTLATLLTDASAAQTWIYDGDYTAFAGVVAGTTTTWVRVRLIRQDTYADVTTVGVDPQIFVTATNEAAGTITLRYTTDTVAPGGDTFTTADVTAPFNIAVMVHATQAADSVGALIGIDPVDTVVYSTGSLAGAIQDMSVQPLGIFSNLSLPAIHGVTRTTGVGGAATILQARNIMADNTGATRVAMTLQDLDNMVAELENASDSTISHYWMNSVTRTEYYRLARAAGDFVIQRGSSADAGFKAEGTGHSGMPIMVDRQFPRRMIFFEAKETWERCTLGDPGFLDEDGQTIRMDPATPSFIGVYAVYFTLACTRPNNNGVITGFSL